MDITKDSETIRQNWNEYKNTILCDSEEYKLLWKSLETKMNLDNSNIYLIMLKDFIDNKKIKKIKGIVIKKENDDTLVLKNLDNIQRKKMHLLCDKIGLLHESKNDPTNDERLFYVYKPTMWQWEFTEQLPFSKSDNRRKKMAKYYCGECGITGDEADLFCSVYIRGYYCEDCLDTVSDGNGTGDVLSCHKFEPI